MQCGWYLCSAPAAILDAFLCLEEKGIVKPGESKKGLEMGILVPTGPSTRMRRPARIWEGRDEGASTM